MGAIEILLQILMNSIFMGGIYAMMGIGLTLIWGVMNFMNFSTGQMVMVAMYVALVAVTLLGIDPLIAVIISTIVLGGLGLLIYKVVIDRIVMEISPLYQVVVTLAIGLILQMTIHTIFGPTIQGIPQTAGSMKFLTKVFQIGVFRLTLVRIMPLPLALTLTIILHLFLTRTLQGLAIRGVSQDMSVGMIMGIDVRRTFFVSWGLGLSFIGLAGGTLMLFQPTHPTVGEPFGLLAMFLVTLGGSGNYIGTFIAAMIVSVVEALSGLYVSMAMKQVVYLILFILILVIRPKGLIPTK